MVAVSARSGALAGRNGWLDGRMRKKLAGGTQVGG